MPRLLAELRFDRFPLRLARQENSGPARARNLALTIATGERVLFTGDDVEPVPPLVALSLFRISQEALRNAARHARAPHATVSLSRDPLGLTLSITDDGEGFDVDGVRQNGGLGLVSIEERARLVRGSATVHSHPGVGTIVVVRVPMEGAGMLRLAPGRTPVAGKPTDGATPRRG